MHWFPKHGKSMDTFRADVKAGLAAETPAPETPTAPKKYYRVQLGAFSVKANADAMIADALDGKIDLILTKSVSRFARNTVDSLTTIRQLKDKGVEVYFEKENIFTLDSKGELLLTIMASLAQEESRSISKNITWIKVTGILREGTAYPGSGQAPESFYYIEAMSVKKMDQVGIDTISN